MRCRPLSFQSIGLDSDRQYMIRMSFGSHSSRTNAQPVTTNNSADVCYIDSTCFTIVNKSDCVTWRDNSFVTSTLHSDTCDVEVKIELLVKAEAGSCGQPDQHVQTNVDIFDTLSSRVLTIASIDRDLHDVCIVTFAHESALGNLDVEIQVESHTSRSSSQIQNYDGSTGPSTVRHWPLQIPCAKVVTLPASSIQTICLQQRCVLLCIRRLHLCSEAHGTSSTITPQLRDWMTVIFCRGTPCLLDIRSRMVCLSIPVLSA